mmetsp:Transcript_3995/g.10831  ORF Transcript_3995/g.10831 Transcript_3995/m.10831 type:complete len:236 (+) Transcript_3995:297-1004(+)
MRRPPTARRCPFSSAAPGSRTQRKAPGAPLPSSRRAARRPGRRPRSRPRRKAGAAAPRTRTPTGRRRRRPLQPRPQAASGSWRSSGPSRVRRGATTGRRRPPPPQCCASRTRSPRRQRCRASAPSCTAWAAASRAHLSTRRGARAARNADSAMSASLGRRLEGGRSTRRSPGLRSSIAEGLFLIAEEFEAVSLRGICDVAVTTFYSIVQKRVRKGAPTAAAAPSDGAANFFAAAP